eukprot:1499125-Rhodomonas_salina.1
MLPHPYDEWIEESPAVQWMGQRARRSKFKKAYRRAVSRYEGRARMEQLARIVSSARGERKKRSGKERGRRRWGVREGLLLKINFVAP